MPEIRTDPADGWTKDPYTCDCSDESPSLTLDCYPRQKARNHDDGRGWLMLAGLTSIQGICGRQMTASFMCELSKA
jgi:hypothetical protein